MHVFQCSLCCTLVNCYYLAAFHLLALLKAEGQSCQLVKEFQLVTENLAADELEMYFVQLIEQALG